jgi:hypothetical protein
MYKQRGLKICAPRRSYWVLQRTSQCHRFGSLDDGPQSRSHRVIKDLLRMTKFLLNGISVTSPVHQAAMGQVTARLHGQFRPL